MISGKPNRTKDGHDVRTVKVADKTGCMNVSVWDQMGDALQTGDICKFLKGQVLQCLCMNVCICISHISL